MNEIKKPKQNSKRSMKPTRHLAIKRKRVNMTNLALQNEIHLVEWDEIHMDELPDITRKGDLVDSKIYFLSSETGDGRQAV
jgi:hypothetical protein